MYNEVLSDEQVAIWIEIIEARGSGLPDQELQAIKKSHVALRTMLDSIATYLERKPHCDEDNCPSRYWATQVRQSLNAEDEEKMITNGHTD